MIRFHKKNSIKQYFIQTFANTKVQIFGFDEMLSILEAYPKMSSRKLKNYIIFGMLKSCKYQNVDVAKECLKEMPERDKRFIKRLMK